MAPMTMAEVWVVVKNGLWILGLSLLLAIWSYARYVAHETGVRTRDVLGAAKWAALVDAGLLLFVSGMATTETRVWARVLWVLLGASILVPRAIGALRTHEDIQSQPNSEGTSKT